MQPNDFTVDGTLITEQSDATSISYPDAEQNGSSHKELVGADDAELASVAESTDAAAERRRRAAAVRNAGAVAEAVGQASDAGAAEPVPFDEPSLYINRELSWLAFNERVIDEARDIENPILVRVFFFVFGFSFFVVFFLVCV